MIWFFDEYEPEWVTGTLILDDGLKPFFWNPKNKTIELRYEKPAKGQETLHDFEKERIAKVILQHLEFPVQAIRIGEYFCPHCQRWIDLGEEEWSVGMCLSCSLDESSRLREHYDSKKS